MVVNQDVFVPKANEVTRVNKEKEKEISQVQQVANEIDVVAATKKKAEELAGLPGTQQELIESRVAERKARETLEQNNQEQLRGSIASMEKKLAETHAEDSGQILALSTKLEAAKAESTRTMFDTLTNKINDLEKMKVESAPTTDIVKQVKGIKELFTELGLINSQQQSSTVPGEMALQMKKMDFDMQQSIEDRADERARRDREWQLTVRKWDEEKEFKKAELAITASAKKEQNGMLMGIIQTIGETVAKSTTVAPAGATPVSAKAQPITTQKKAIPEDNKEKPAGAIPIQVPEGQSGQFECVNCPGLVAVAEDAEGAMCAECETIYSVARVPA